MRTKKSTTKNYANTGAISGNIYFCCQIIVLIHKLRQEAIRLYFGLTRSLYHNKLCLPSFTIVKRVSGCCKSLSVTSTKRTQEHSPHFNKVKELFLFLHSKVSLTTEIEKMLSEASKPKFYFSLL